MKLLMVASGEAHVYPRLAPTSEWDTCAAQAIGVCAGGSVLQFAGGKECDAGKPVVYGKAHPLNPFFVVYGAREVRRAPAKKKDLLEGGGGVSMPVVGACALGLGALAFLALA